MTLPFEARNEVPFIIVGFADRPVSNVSRSQPFFLPTKAMQNNFRKFEELVFFDLWIPDSGFPFQIPVSDSGFRFPAPDSGFRFPGFRVALVTRQTLNLTR